MQLTFWKVVHLGNHLHITSISRQKRTTNLTHFCSTRSKVVARGLHFSQLFKQMSTYPTQISSPTVGSSSIVSSSNYLYHDEEEDIALVTLHNKSSTHKRPISNTISFLLNGKTVSIDNPDPQLVLADYLRQDLKLTGTKKPCGEGGCGGKL